MNAKIKVITTKFLLNQETTDEKGENKTYEQYLKQRINSRSVKESFALRGSRKSIRSMNST